jgi:hypothetical protein
MLWLMASGTQVTFDLQSLVIQAALPGQSGGALAHQVNIDLLRAINTYGPGDALSASGRISGRLRGSFLFDV